MFDIQSKLQKQYGFTIDSKLPIFLNAMNVIGQISTVEYFGDPSHAVCHDLTKKYKPPAGAIKLLGKGLNYALSERYLPSGPDFDTLLFNRVEKHVRRVLWFRPYSGLPDPKPKFIPQLHIPSEWDPPESENQHIEDQLREFREEVSTLRRARMKVPHRFNLSNVEEQAMYELSDSDFHIVGLTDKNCGSFIMDRDEYISRCLTDHLLTSSYKRLERQEYDDFCEELQEKKGRMMSLLRSYYSMVAMDEYLASNPGCNALDAPKHPVMKFFDRTEEWNRTPQFYALIKVHKTPWKTRPITDQAFSSLTDLSMWVSWQLQKALPFVRSYIRDTESFLSDIKSNGPYPSNARFGSTDAVSMYTNIDTAHAIPLVRRFLLEKVKPNLPSGEDFPVENIVKALDLVMRYSAFQFGDTYWRQVSGTAMGTPCAVPYATIYFAVHEEYVILPEFGEYMPYFGRFVDDKAIIWTGSEADYARFNERMDECGLLRWEAEPLADCINFLDVTLEFKILEDGTKDVKSKPYFKPTNLYQYIPPRSAHPIDQLRSLIYGRLRAFKIQSSYVEDYEDCAKLLFRRLRVRGWDPTVLRKMFLDAASHLSRKTSSRLTVSAPVDSDQRLFLHIPYHPGDLSRRDYRMAFERTCNQPFRDWNLVEHLDIRQVTVATHRARTLRQVMMRSKLHQAEGEFASDIAASLSLGG